MHAQVIMHVFDDAVPIDQPFKLGSENLVVHQEWYTVFDKAGHKDVNSLTVTVDS